MNKNKQIIPSILKIAAIQTVICNTYSTKYECKTFQEVINTLHQILNPVDLNVTPASASATPTSNTSDITLEQLARILKANTQTKVFGIDPGEVVVHCSQPEYTRDITGRLYGLSTNHDISILWRTWLMPYINEHNITVETMPHIFTASGFHPVFTDFVYSTAAFVNPTKLVHNNWKDLLKILSDTQNTHTCFLSTMHPHYTRAREQMLSSLLTLSDQMPTFQNHSKLDSLNVFLRNRNINNTLNPLLIIIDDNKTKLEEIEQQFPTAHLIEYSEGVNKKSQDIRPDTLPWRDNNDEMFLDHMKAFWTPILIEAFQNYSQFLSARN